MITLETDRLRLRPLTHADLGFVAGMHADEEVARYIGHGTPRSEVETLEWLVKTLGWYEYEGIGHLGVERKSDGRLLGRCGLNCFEIEDGPEIPRGFWGRGSAPAGLQVTPCLELGYTFAPAFWGQGYATEAARHVRDHAFEDRGEARLISLIHPDNVRSMRVATRLGMKKQHAVQVFATQAWRFVLDGDAWFAGGSS